jgi:hypothetical protein
MMTPKANVQPINQPQPSYAELQARIAELEAQQRSTSKISFKISPKGAVSAYGLGRFPVTLYFEQWLRLLDFADALRAFIQTNRNGGRLKTKAESQADAA